MSADAWFFSLYQTLGESIANDDETTEPDPVEYGIVPNNNPLLSSSTMLISSTGTNVAPKRFLNPGTFQDLVSLYQQDPCVPDHDRVSPSTLFKCWKKWEVFMPFRNIGQGKRCTDCAEIDALRSAAISDEERTDLARRKQQHISEVQDDRTCHVRGNARSERDARTASSDGVGQMIKLSVDGMDQAKFRCPRNLVNLCKFMEALSPVRMKI